MGEPTQWVVQREWVARDERRYWFESRKDSARLWIRLIYPLSDGRALYTVDTIAFDALGQTNAERQDILGWIRERLLAQTRFWLNGHPTAESTSEG